MPYSSGTFTLAAGNPVTTGTTISSTWANNTLTDVATGLSTCVLKDGTQTITANLPMSGFKFTGLGNGSASSDSLTLLQAQKLVQNSAQNSLSTVVGTNTITATATPTLTAYATGQRFSFVPAATNTGAATINIDGVGAKNIFNNGAALISGELVIGVPAIVFYDGTQFNIANSVPASGTTASTFTFNGSGGTSGSLTMSWTKIGNVVSLYIPTAQATSGTGSTTFTSNTALPSAIRPTTNQQQVCTVSFNNGATSGGPGAIKVDTSGIVTFLRDGSATAYTNSTTCGTGLAMTYTYMLGI